MPFRERDLNMKVLVKISGLALLALTAIASGSNSHHASHHGGASAPIGVMGHHMHQKGEFMLSYRHMRMKMDENLIGDSSISAQEIVGSMQQPGQFMVAPTSMPMRMHMFGGMYGLNDNITLMAMVTYLDNEMDHLVRNGRTFKTESKGFGDTKVSALIRLFESHHLNAHWSLGLSLPTGSIDEVDDTPAMSNAVLPYPMQLGSGTYDLLPSITAVTSHGLWSLGTQVSAEIRTGTNDEGYSLGDKFKATAWLARKFSHKVSASVRLEFVDQGNIDGQNLALNPMMVQTANPNLQAYTRISAGLGLDYRFDNGQSLTVEYTTPVSQDVDGPQMKLDSKITVGWQKAF